MLGSSRFPASLVVEALQLIEKAATAIEVGQGGLNQVKTIMASLTTIWHAVDRNAGEPPRSIPSRSREPWLRSRPLPSGFGCDGFSGRHWLNFAIVWMPRA